MEDVLFPTLRERLELTDYGIAFRRITAGCTTAAMRPDREQQVARARACTQAVDCVFVNGILRWQQGDLAAVAPCLDRTDRLCSRRCSATFVAHNVSAE